MTSSRPAATEDTARSLGPGGAGGVGGDAGLRSRLGRLWARAAAAPRAPEALMALLVAAIVPLHLWLLRGSVPFGDEVGWASQYRGIGTNVLGTWFGWFDPLARLAYNVLFAAVGLESYLPFRLMALVFNLALAGAVFWYCRTIGRPLAGVAVAAFLLLFGNGVHTVLYPLNSINAVGMASLPAGLVLLARGRRSSDRLALAMLLVAMGFDGPIVLTACAGLAVWLLAERPIRPRRLLVPVVPPLVYGAAVLLLPENGVVPNTPLVDNLLGAPRYMIEAAAGAAGAIAGLDPASGSALLALGVVALVVGVPRLSAPARRRALALGTTALVSWVMLAVSRGQVGAPATSRYLILSVVPMLLIAVELSALVRGRAVRVALLAGLGAATIANLGILKDFAASIRIQSEIERAHVTALDLAGDRAPAGYRPGSGLVTAVLFVDAGGWREASRHLGSFGFEPREIPAASPIARVEIDRVLRELRSLAVGSEPGSVAPGPGCVTSAGEAHVLPMPPAGLAVAATGTAPVQLDVKRFADAYDGVPDLTVAPGTQVRIRPIQDASTTPWSALVSGQYVACPRER